MKKNNLLFSLILLGVVINFADISWSHEGHDHKAIPSAGTVIGGKITLSPEAVENIALKVEDVEERSIDEVVKSNGIVITDQNKAAHVSSRISGRVLKILVNIGEEVQKNQELVEIESRQIGSPPPTLTLKSPISGTVIDRDITLGQTVEPEKHLFEIADLNSVLIEGEIYEEDVPKIKIGQKARITLPVAFPGKLFEGDVSYMSQTLDPEKRTTHVWVRVPNQEQFIKPGMLAQAAIIIKEKKDAIAIPKEAVLQEGGEKFVFLETGKNTFSRQSVILGFSNDNYVEIKQGLIPGDRVVVSGGYELRITELTAPQQPKESEKKAK